MLFKEACFFADLRGADLRGAVLQGLQLFLVLCQTGFFVLDVFALRIAMVFLLEVFSVFILSFYFLWKHNFMLMIKIKLILVFFAVFLCQAIGLAGCRECAFCDKEVLDSQKFYEDVEVLGLCSYRPVFEGHCLIIPKRHVERFEDLTDEELAHIFALVKRLHAAMTEVLGVQSYLILQKNGKEAGQTEMHVHFHYIPRKAGAGSAWLILPKMILARFNLDEREILPL